MMIVPEEIYLINYMIGESWFDDILQWGERWRYFLHLTDAMGNYPLSMCSDLDMLL